MKSNVLNIEECCAWCRRPAELCTDLACDDIGTYSGVLIQGEWHDLDAPATNPEAQRALQALTAA
jgi:hypothetical protein